MKYALRTAIAIGAIAIASPAAAEPVKQVVELFTSQSCSSCPPADRLFGEVVRRDGIIGLAWHVDYWNYLDWKDTFSSSEATKRQYAYAKAFGTKQVYTPQFVLNGRTSIDPDSLVSATGTGSAEPLPVELSATASKDRLVIRTGGGKGDANLIMVQFDDEETVNVANGENSGRTLTNHYAVTGMHTVGMWSGKAMQIDLPLDEYMPKKGMGCAVLLQRMDGAMPGEIIGAATISWK